MSKKGLSAEKLEEIKEAFWLYDKNGDGKISARDLGVCLRAMGTNPTEAEVADLLKQAGISRDGRVTEDEFIRMMAKLNETPRTLSSKEQQQALMQAFRLFDLDGNGYVTAAELRHVLSTLGEPLSTKEIEDIIAEGDRNRDGKLDYKEFIAGISGR